MSAPTSAELVALLRRMLAAYEGRRMIPTEKDIVGFWQEVRDAIERAEPAGQAEAPAAEAERLRSGLRAIMACAGADDGTAAQSETWRVRRMYDLAGQALGELPSQAPAVAGQDPAGASTPRPDALTTAPWAVTEGPAPLPGYAYQVTSAGPTPWPVALAVTPADAQAIRAIPDMLATLRAIYTRHSFCFSPNGRDVASAAEAATAITAATGRAPESG